MVYQIKSTQTDISFRLAQYLSTESTSTSQFNIFDICLQRKDLHALTRFWEDMVGFQGSEI
jgi:hypothetical protein